MNYVNIVEILKRAVEFYCDHKRNFNDHTEVMNFLNELAEKYEKGKLENDAIVRVAIESAEKDIENRKNMLNNKIKDLEELRKQLLK